MSGRIGAYIKIGVLVVLAIYVLAFVVINSDTAVQVWLFPGLTLNTNALLLMIIVAALTLLLWVFGKQMWLSVRRLKRHAAQKS